jgi:hypothetical protein
MITSFFGPVTNGRIATSRSKAVRIQSARVLKAEKNASRVAWGHGYTFDLLQLLLAAEVCAASAEEHLALERTRARLPAWRAFAVISAW